MNIKMYRRENGSYGARNRIAVIPTVACVNHVVQLIASAVEIADAYTHPYGCDQLGYDKELSSKCLAKMGIHPNNGAVLVVGLGCEEILPLDLYKAIKSQQPNTELLVMQEVGGTEKTVEIGREICKKFAAKLEGLQKVETDIANLTVGVECGGSDFTSGIASNPAVGVFTEKLTALGGKVVFGETTELMGAEDIIKEHCASEEIYNFIVGKIKKVEDIAIDMKVDLRGTQPSPGNIEGGLSTIEEKSLGGVCKIGRALIVAALEFGDTATKSGVSFVDTPGNDMACSLGLSAAGAQIIIFTTGRGTPMGFAAAPVIKVTANSKVAQLMRENFDIDLSDIVEGDTSIAAGGETIFNQVLAVAEGELTAAEKLGHREFSLYRVSPILT
ncbi:MAG: UxaA family hydrolase [Clostridiales bacterium]